MSSLPNKTRVLVLKESPARDSPLYHDIVIEERVIPTLKEGEILVKMGAVSYNRRELWMRRGLYPGIVLGVTLDSTVGMVVASADKDDSPLNKRVFLVPMKGWESSPDAPELISAFVIIGGTRLSGTFADYVVVERDGVIQTPDHLDDIHMAAWPLGGVTAWRATVVNAQVTKGQSVLVTGIGGGVALLAVQICVAKGVNVYVTSGSEDKIQKAIQLGARGGVNYKNREWSSQLAKLIEQNTGNGTPQLDAVIDSAGGDIMKQVNKILKPGGRVVVFGMTATPVIKFTMHEVLKHHRLIGSTMGSRKDLIDATEFLAEHQIVPVVSHVLEGLDSAEEGFELLKNGEQFGKVVIRMGNLKAKASL
ncbi:hypothetical protein V8B97DRAFT_2045323 [Scleroderma yunnanense]